MKDNVNKLSKFIASPTLVFGVMTYIIIVFNVIVFNVIVLPVIMGKVWFLSIFTSSTAIWIGWLITPIFKSEWVKVYSNKH